MNGPFNGTEATGGLGANGDSTSGLVVIAASGSLGVCVSIGGGILGAGTCSGVARSSTGFNESSLSD